jgi:hypothetical protein
MLEEALIEKNLVLKWRGIRKGININGRVCVSIYIYIYIYEGHTHRT